MCRIDYDDGYSFWLTEPHEVTARKTHRCQDCGRTITAGERYHYGTVINEGDLAVVKMCAQCVAAGRWLRKVCGGHYWPGVIEELVEHWDEEPELRSLSLGRLIVAARGSRRWAVLTRERGRPASASEIAAGLPPTRWRDRRGELIPVEVVERWVDDALAHTPEEAMA